MSTDSRFTLEFIEHTKADDPEFFRDKNTYTRRLSLEQAMREYPKVALLRAIDAARVKILAK